jgi:protein phosphatase
LMRNRISAEEARSHPGRNQLLRFAGMDEPHPEARSIPLRADDRMLLCSDGLTKPLSDTAIAFLLQRECSPDRACHTLIEAANRTDGSDNVTAIVVDVIGLPSRPA